MHDDITTSLPPWPDAPADPFEQPGRLVDPDPGACEQTARLGEREAAARVLGPLDFEYAVWSAQSADDLRSLAGQAEFLGADDPSLDSAEPLDELARLDRIQARLDASRLRLLATFYTERLDDDLAKAVHWRDVGRTAALEVSMTRRVSTQAAARQVARAATVGRDYPALVEAVEEGVVTISGVDEVIAAGQGLPADKRDDLAKLVADDALAFGLTPGQVGLVARRHALALDPNAAVARAERAREQRSVRLVPLPDQVAELTIRTRAEDAHASLERLSKAARSAKAKGDPRTLCQLRADLALDYLTSGVLPDERPPRPIEIQVVIGADTLLGTGSEPGLLRGYGAISPTLAKCLAASDKVWLRRLVCDPRDGHLISMSRRTRLFRGELKAFLAYQAQTCAVETCERPVEQSDHIIPVADGGVTTIEGGQGLCAGHNLAKEHLDVTVTRDHADDSTTWVMPSGRTYTQHPPPVLGYGSGDPPWHRLYPDDTEDLDPPF